MQEGIISCIIVTSRGFVPCDLFYEQLMEARRLINHLNKGEEIVFCIVVDGRDVEAIDVLMEYSTSPEQKERR